MITRRRDHIVERRVDDEAVLVPIRTSTDIPLTVHALGPVATYIWEQLDGARDDAALARLVCAEFDVEVERATADVAVFLAELVAADLVEVI